MAVGGKSLGVWRCWVALLGTAVQTCLFPCVDRGMPSVGGSPKAVPKPS